MTPLDVFIMAAVALGILRGFATGFVRQVVGLTGLVVAFVLAVELMPFLGSVLGPAVGGEGVGARLLAFVLVFLAVQISFYFLSRLAEAAAGALRLTALNRLAGSAVGALKALLLVSVVLVLLARLAIPSDDTRQQSVLYGPAVLLVPSAWDLVASVWPRVQTLSTRFGDEVRSRWSEGDE